MFLPLFSSGKVSARMKSDTPLTNSELQKFKISCDAIIRDSKGSKPIENSTVSNTKSDNNGNSNTNSNGNLNTANQTPTRQTQAKTPVVKNIMENIAVKRETRDIVHKPPPLLKKKSNMREGKIFRLFLSTF